MEIKTDQITALLKEQLEKYDNSVDVSEVGGNFASLCLILH